MKWQMIVLVAQLVLGGGLLLGGLRRVARLRLPQQEDHADYLTKRLGEPPVRSLGLAVTGDLRALVGALMLTTTDRMTIEMLAPPRLDQ